MKPHPKLICCFLPLEFLIGSKKSSTLETSTPKPGREHHRRSRNQVERHQSLRLRSRPNHDNCA